MSSTTNFSRTAKGDIFILSETLLWSLFPIITVLSYAYIDPLTSLAWGSLLASLFFGCAMLLRGKTKELFRAEIYSHIFLVAFFIGWLFYGLYFTGLKYTTPDNASIIALMEVFFSYLLFNVWKKQPFSQSHTAGAVLMLLGAFIILFPKDGLSFHGGDWMILCATACTPIGNYYQQKLRQIVSSETILFLRSLLTFPFVFLLTYLMKTSSNWVSVKNVAGLLLLNGFVILGASKIFWIEGIHRISVTKANALASIGPLFTILFAFFILKQSPTIWQLGAFIPLAGGLILLTKSNQN